MAGGSRASDTQIRRIVSIPGLITTANGQQATSTSLGVFPVPGSQLEVYLNGQFLDVGVSGNHTGKPCYFSGDGGITPRVLGQVKSTDKLYWNGSISGFELSTLDNFEISVITD